MDCIGRCANMGVTGRHLHTISEQQKHDTQKDDLKTEVYEEIITVMAKMFLALSLFYNNKTSLTQEEEERQQLKPISRRSAVSQIVFRLKDDCLVSEIYSTLKCNHPELDVLCVTMVRKEYIPELIEIDNVILNVDYAYVAICRFSTYPFRECTIQKSHYSIANVLGHTVFIGHLQNTFSSGAGNLNFTRMKMDSYGPTVIYSMHREGIDLSEYVHQDHRLRISQECATFFPKTMNENFKPMEDTYYYRDDDCKCKNPSKQDHPPVGLLSKSVEMEKFTRFMPNVMLSSLPPFLCNGRILKADLSENNNTPDNKNTVDGFDSILDENASMLSICLLLKQLLDEDGNYRHYRVNDQDGNNVASICFQVYSELPHYNVCKLSSDTGLSKFSSWLSQETTDRLMKIFSDHITIPSALVTTKSLDELFRTVRQIGIEKTSLGLDQFIKSKFAQDHPKV